MQDRHCAELGLDGVLGLGLFEVVLLQLPHDCGQSLAALLYIPRQQVAQVGWSVHRELQLWQEAGLLPWEILRSATTRIGEFLGVRWGVQWGGVAHLLVVKGDPLRGIANTDTIAAVAVCGQDRAVARAVGPHSPDLEG